MRQSCPGPVLHGLTGRHSVNDQDRIAARRSSPPRRGFASRIRAAGPVACALLASASVFAATGGTSAATPAKAMGQSVEGSKRMSNERTVTRWAHPGRKAPIRFRPKPDSRRIAPTRVLTEDGYPEVYLVLRKWRSPTGRSWLKVRIPTRPNGRSGWLRRRFLGPLYLTRKRLVVNRTTRRASLYDNGRRIWRAPVGIGKAATPTPAGRFWIREKFRTSQPKGMYGPMAFGTSAYSVLSDWPGGGVIGIHGTDAPGLIPGRPSHGCIRVRNPELRRLWRVMPIGTPVLIRS